METKFEMNCNLRSVRKIAEFAKFFSRRLFLFCISLSLLIGLNSCNNVKTTKEIPDWGGITVKVKANQPVETSQKLTTGDDGFQRLSITLSNNGTESVAIESIVVQVPLSDTLSEKMKVAYGGSAMGTPVLVHKVGEQQKESLSFMYAMVQMKPDNYLFAGSLSWRIFLPEFKLEDNAFVIQTNGEGKVLKPGESINYEQIVLSRSKSWQNLLDTYGSAIAKENGVNQLKDVEYRGWATWDYYGGNFSDEDIYENIKQIKEIAPLSNLIQIDAGWYSQMGDFSTPRPDLPGGIKAIADSINAARMTPGVWIDGFRANTDSEIFKNHPEYFLHDEEGNVIFHDRTSVKTVFFDYSHPGTARYMAECIRVLKEEKGFPYFKVDFIGYGLNRNILKGTKTFKGIKPYDPSITDVERVRIGLKAIRKAIGPENYFLGCSAVFGPCIGYVDGMRTGRDIHPNFEDFSERVRCNLGNAYLSGKVFNGDADYLLFRAAEDEDETVAMEKAHKYGGTVTLNEAQMWADASKLYGNCRLSSDKLPILRKERQDLIPEVFDYPAMEESIPLDLWQHATERNDGFELLLARHDKDVYLGIFNWSDKPKEYPVTAFEQGVQKLEARHSSILKYNGSKSFKELSEALSAELNK